MGPENKVKIKICGLSREREMDWVNEALPDYIGFVFWRESRRMVTRRQAAELKRKLRPEIRAAGVFVNEKPEAIIQMLHEGIIDLAQLHGNETEEQVRLIRRRTGKPVIKAVKMQSAGDLEPWRDTEADYLLLDAGMGEGKPFDWNLIGGVEKPFFLAGGLNPGNVTEAIEKLHPFGVDVSSGVETDGAKDPAKIRQIIRSVQDEQRKIWDSRGTVYIRNPHERID